MNERQRADQLDRFIDSLLTGEAVDLATIADPELRELCTLALALRRAVHPLPAHSEELAVRAQWVARSLATASRSPRDRSNTLLTREGREDRAPAVAGGPVAWIGTRRRGLRGLKPVVELLAAAVVVGAFAWLLVLLLGGRSQTELGSRPATAPAPVTIPAVSPVPRATPSPVAEPHVPGVPVSPVYPLMGVARTDGEHVVWVVAADPELTRFRIEATRLDGGPVVTVQSVVVHPGRFDLDSGVLVWDEADPACATGCPAVYAKRIATGEMLVVADSEGEVHDEAPAVSGRWVVWLQLDPGSGEQAVMARDLDRMAEPVTLTERRSSELELHPPVIDGEWVAWAEGSDDAPQHPLVLARIGDGWREIVSPDVRTGGYGLGGGVLVYIERRRLQGTGGDGMVETLFARRLETGETTVVRGPLPAGRIHPSTPDTDGRYVFWAEYGDEPSVAELWGHDLASGQSFRITSGGLDREPQVGGRWLVWIHRLGPDLRDQVYAARIEELVTPR